LISDIRSDEVRKAIVPGSGPAGATLAFIAASPSELEGIRRIPLVGPAGRVFKEHYLDPLGLTRDQVILAHVIPEVLKSDGRIRGPSQAEIDTHLPSLLKALDDSKPRVVIALGRVAKYALGDRAALVLPHPLAIISKGDRGEVARKLKQIKGLVQKGEPGSAQPFHRIIKGYCTLHNSKGGTFVVNAPGLDCKGSDKSSVVSSASGVPGSNQPIIPSGRPSVIRLWLRSHPDERAVVRSIKNGKAEVRLAGSGDLLGTFSIKDLPEGLAEGDRLYPVSSGLIIIKPRSDSIKRHTHEAYHTPEENALNHEPRLEDDTTSWLAREMSPEAKVSVTHIDPQTKEAILTSEARSWQARIPLNLLPDPQVGDIIYGTSGKLSNKRTGESTDLAPLIDYILHNTEAPGYFKNLIKPYEEGGPDINAVTKALEEPRVINISSDIMKAEGYATILKADEDKRIVCGVVLEPGTFDLQRDRLSADEIRRSGEDYLKESRIFFDRHRKPARAELVKFWFAEDDQKVLGQLVKAGSWVLCVHVSDDKIWDKIKRGEYTGFSVGGRGVRIPVRIAA